MPRGKKNLENQVVFENIFYQIKKIKTKLENLVGLENTF